jgi:hypothetical protein
VLYEAWHTPVFRHCKVENLLTIDKRDQRLVSGAERTHEERIHYASPAMFWIVLLEGIISLSAGLFHELSKTPEFGSDIRHREDEIAATADHRGEQNFFFINRSMKASGASR